MIPRAELLGSYKQGHGDEHILKQPYAAIFESRGRKLIFIASRHVNAFSEKNYTEHPTIKTIDWAFDTHRPEIVIFEGANTGGDEASLTEKEERAHACEQKAFHGPCAEPFYALSRAMSRGARYRSGEPSHTEIRRALSKEGVSDIELAGLYLLQRTANLREAGKLTAESFPADAEAFLDRLGRSMGFARPVSFADFEKWFRAEVSPKEDPFVIPVDATYPKAPPEGTYVQRLQNRVGHVRDVHLLETIMTGLGESKSVLVVYGGSHYLMQRPALEAELGQPHYVKPH